MTIIIPVGKLDRAKAGESLRQLMADYRGSEYIYESHSLPKKVNLFKNISTWDKFKTFFKF